MVGRRLLSWFVDYLVILAWLAILVVVVGLPSLAGWFDLDELWSNRVASDLAITVLTVVPLFSYLVVTESRPAHGTWGKRRAGLEVIEVDGAEASLGEVTTRNLVKVLPWQLGHMGAIRLAAGEAEAIGMAFSVSALVLLAAVAGPPLIGRRGIHEVTARTAVIARSG